MRTVVNLERVRQEIVDGHAAGAAPPAAEAATRGGQERLSAYNELSLDLHDFVLILAKQKLFVLSGQNIIAKQKLFVLSGQNIIAKQKVLVLILVLPKSKQNTKSCRSDCHQCKV